MFKPTYNLYYDDELRYSGIPMCDVTQILKQSPNYIHLKVHNGKKIYDHWTVKRIGSEKYGTPEEENHPDPFIEERRTLLQYGNTIVPAKRLDDVEKRLNEEGIEIDKKPVFRETSLLTLKNDYGQECYVISLKSEVKEETR